MHILLLSGENIELARAEAESLLGLDITSLEENLLYCTIPTKNLNLIGRLAYTKKAFEILYSTKIDNIEESLSNYPWKNYYVNSFCVRIDNRNMDVQYDERHFAKYIWVNLEKSLRPAVDLKNPQLSVHIFIHKNRCDVSMLMSENVENYEDRKAHLRPILHPTAMHPKMARALVNLLNKKSIIDPFCGVGGIIMEAALMGIKARGYDISKNILEDAKTNMMHYGISPKRYSLVKKDSTTLKSLKDVVTDLPYGKSSKKSDEIDVLYRKFLRKISGDAIIVMPDFINYKKLLKENLKKSLAVKKVINHYVHKSLTRKIIIIKAR